MADDALILYTNRLFTGNRSQVHRWGRRLGNDFEGLARAWAPARSGRLKASIFSELEGQGRTLDIIVGARGEIAPHWPNVIFGSGQYIGNPRLRNPNGKALPVGKSGFWGPKRLVFNEGLVYFWKGNGPFVGRGVSGQKPNNFFETAHHFLIPLHPSTAYIDWHDVPNTF